MKVRLYLGKTLMSVYYGMQVLNGLLEGVWEALCHVILEFSCRRKQVNNTRVASVPCCPRFFVRVFLLGDLM